MDTLISIWIPRGAALIRGNTVVDTIIKKIKEYSSENTVHKKLAITTHSRRYNQKIEGIFV